MCYIVKPKWVSEDLFFPACSDVQCLLEYSLDTFKNVSWQTERVVMRIFSRKYIVIAGINKSK